MCRLAIYSLVFEQKKAKLSIKVRDIWVNDFGIATMEVDLILWPVPIRERKCLFIAWKGTDTGLAFKSYCSASSHVQTCHLQYTSRIWTKKDAKLSIKVKFPIITGYMSQWCRHRNNGSVVLTFSSRLGRARPPCYIETHWFGVPREIRSRTFVLSPQIRPPSYPFEFHARLH